MSPIKSWMQKYGINCNVVRFKEAITHPSAKVDNTSIKDYEQLETIGDAVLGLLAIEYILDNFPDASPSQLTKGRSNIVNNRILGSIGKLMGIHKILITSNHYQIVENDLSKSLEAIFGAIYLDTGMIECGKFFNRIIGNVTKLGGIDIDSKYSNPIGNLQEFTQKEKIAYPEYIEIDQTGPDNNPKFTIKVSIDYNDQIIRSTGIGSSKKNAREIAARNLLSKLYRI